MQAGMGLLKVGTVKLKDTLKKKHKEMDSRTLTR